jgi:uncharacterized protein YjbI with pentapeptide repeats
MIVIRCETGEDISVAGESLAGADLTNLNLHRALLSGQSLAGANLSGSDLGNSGVPRERADSAASLAHSLLQTTQDGRS